MKKNIFKVLLVCIIIFSLGLNVILLFEKSIYKGVSVNTNCNKDNNDDNKKVEYDKNTLGKLFKNYQTSRALADQDNTVIFDVTKITYVGYFKNNPDKKLYYIDEKYSCMQGVDCVKTGGKVTLDDEHNNNTTFVVSVVPVNKYNALFEILDYSIEESENFQKEDHVELR